MVDFSEREKELMALAWQCFEEEPKIQFPKLAEMAGMTNAGSASNAWRNIKKKLATIAAGNGNGSADGVTTPKVKATPKRKKKAANDDDDDAEETPAKKTKATPKKKAKKAAAEENGYEEDDDEEKPKVKADTSESDDLA
ncbi:hypothetical protein M409DRAFT_59956 [Zasmidium cellare ATCC 36951]|uniref:Myb-like domain-containing protein n=1 Tax=Zasmidium cellare ATCC 36951 TaxID=1080233 RepID=A0A6A6C515_ZASCE|nr:uncharacterized protein M409DRAFT_59956 [Zasmidium cellare ATCC 36951]KAF2160476.1 hypothetical protein M409DRAFT_59956 [Zasmidium cellare ATCC 36951]